MEASFSSVEKEQEMGDELDLLRDLGREGGASDEASVSRARALLQRRIDGAQGGRRPWRPFHLRWGLTVAVALLLGSGFGFALGTSDTSNSTAANAPVGLGFLPERGWSVLQTAKKATLAQEAIAIAANVPLSSDDAADRLPYSTMLSLPSNGVVILASFTARGDEWRDEHYPVRKLPLALRDAAPGSLQVRPERPLGQYRLHAGINGHNVEVTVYFGTPRPTPALITAAQRQLDRLVVRPVRAGDQVEERAFPMRFAARPRVQVRRATTRVIDRTLVCALVAPPGEAHDLDVLATPPVDDDFRNFHVPAFIGAGSGRVIATPVTDRSNRVFVRARPFPLPHTTRTLPAGVFASTRSCTATRNSVPLSARGLPGAPVEFEQEAECRLRGRILVRVRAVLHAPAAWRPVASGYAGARANVVEAALAVRSARTRKPLAFMQLRPQGKTRFWASPGCG
jgi:hypothetical protein